MSDRRNAPVPTPETSGTGKRKRRMTARWQYTNRLNAGASTGPRTPGGKARVARNALSHGLSLPALRDPALAPEVDELARRIAQSVVGRQLDDARHELACRIAEAIIDRRRVRTATEPVMAEMEADVENCLAPLKRLERLRRYELRAVARRNRAVREFYAALVGPRVVAMALLRLNKAFRVNNFNEAQRWARRVMSAPPATNVGATGKTKPWAEK